MAYGRDWRRFRKIFEDKGTECPSVTLRTISQRILLSPLCKLCHNVEALEIDLLVKYQFPIIEINFSPTKDTFLDRISAGLLTPFRRKYLDLRGKIANMGLEKIA
jgi:hypothetical protein